MERRLGDLNFNNILIYWNDLNIFSKNFEEHIKYLDQVFTHMVQNGLKRKSTKYHLMQACIQYLGHVVEAEGVSPYLAKVQNVRDWPIPKTVTGWGNISGLFLNSLRLRHPSHNYFVAIQKKKLNGATLKQ